MGAILRTDTRITISPPTKVAEVTHKGVGFDWMVANEERSTPTNSARGIFTARWHAGKGVPKLYSVPEPVPCLYAMHTHQQAPTFGGRCLNLRTAAPRLAGSPVGDFDEPLPNGGYLFRGAGHRWGLWDIPCVSSGPPGSGPTTLGASVSGMENFTIRLLPVVQYEDGCFSLRVNFGQRHYFWWTQQPGAYGGDSYFGFHRYTDYAADTSKQVIPATHLARRAQGNWVQLNFLTFDGDTILCEVLDGDGEALARALAHEPTLQVEDKDIEIELYVESGLLGLGVTDHVYHAAAAPPATVPDEDASDDPDDIADDLALAYPLDASVYVPNPNDAIGKAFGHTPAGTSMTVYAQKRAGTSYYRPVVALTTTATRTPVLAGAQLYWPTVLAAGSGSGVELTDIRSAPTARYAKDYRSNYFAVEYALGSQTPLKGNEYVEVVIRNTLVDGTIEDEQPLFTGFVSEFSTESDERDQEVLARIEARDWTLRLEKKDLGDTPGFGGWALRDAVEFVCERSGIPTSSLVWEQSPDDWEIPKRASFKLEFKFDEASTAVEALDSLLMACGFTWGTGFDGKVHLWAHSADYVDAGAVIDDGLEEQDHVVELATRRDLDGFANEILLVTSSLRGKTDPTIARIGNPDSQHDPDDDLYIGEEWTRTIRYDDSYPPSLVGWLELERATRGRRLLGFRPVYARLDLIPRHVVTAEIGGHDFAPGTRFGVLRALYAIEDVGGLPRLASEFVLAKLKE